jgi:elongation factor G
MNQFQLPTPVLYIAVHPKNKNDEDKISMALHRLNLEDPTFEIKEIKKQLNSYLGGHGYDTFRLCLNV